MGRLRGAWGFVWTQRTFWIRYWLWTIEKQLFNSWPTFSPYLYNRVWSELTCCNSLSHSRLACSRLSARIQPSVNNPRRQTRPRVFHCRQWSNCNIDRRRNHSVRCLMLPVWLHCIITGEPANRWDAVYAERRFCMCILYSLDDIKSYRLFVHCSALFTAPLTPESLHESVAVRRTLWTDGSAGILLANAVRMQHTGIH